MAAIAEVAGAQRATVRPDAQQRLQDPTRPFVQRRAQALVAAGKAPAESGFGVNSATDQAMVDVRARYNQATLKARTRNAPVF